MTTNVALIDKFADELHWAVAIDFFSIKELKSVAKSIDWPCSFFNISSKLKLKEQMVYLCSFLGQNAIKLYIGVLFDRNFAEISSERYIEKLTCRWLLQSDLPKCKEKVSRWESLGILDAYYKIKETGNDEDTQFYLEIIQKISGDFYESLTQKKCDDDIYKFCLTRRFNLYFAHFIEIINAVATKLGIE
ncbi:MAG: hypothetical protein FVQ82_02620 [Planctomycetes bacterium]|nr:hypothetical protein [Planctomycetota bacterium]